ncbi:SAF domain-containing protein [Terrabacter sp. GCM10028922]|uniref:SAF domain-containing protein n=1 Tax=Terrabacter sp. GCM10028922 TaxID=3273428 RepID=UPI003617BE69
MTGTRAAGAAGPVPDSPRRRRARRARWRRWVAAVLAGVAVLVTVGALRPAPADGSGVPTVVVVRDVAAGQVVTRDDVELAGRPAGQRPSTALAAVEPAVGRVAAGPLTAREVVTSERLVGGGLLAGQPTDHVAISVPVVDVSSTGVGAGSRVDVYATGSGTRAATDVVVLAVHDAGESTGLGSATPPRVTLALDPRQAGELARSLSALEAGQSLVVAIRQPGASSQ